MPRGRRSGYNDEQLSFEPCGRSPNPSAMNKYGRHGDEPLGEDRPGPPRQIPRARGRRSSRSWGSGRRARSSSCRTSSRAPTVRGELPGEGRPAEHGPAAGRGAGAPESILIPGPHRTRRTEGNGRRAASGVDARPRQDAPAGRGRVAAREVRARRLGSSRRAAHAPGLRRTSKRCGVLRRPERSSASPRATSS